MSININIESVLKKFGEEHRIFQKEAQFQFELAWELQKQIEQNKDSSHNVFLEFLGCQKKNKTKKRFYSDIVIKDKDGNFIVIELKYKTKKHIYTSSDGEKIELAGHGASDEGRYDYLLDIHRIELLKNPNHDEYDYSESLKHFEKGYAIMLTNEKQYWSRTKSEAEEKNTVDKFFSIGNQDIIKGNIDWNIKNEEDRKPWMKSRNGFHIDGTYKCIWKPYFKEGESNGIINEPKFMYLITEIK